MSAEDFEVVWPLGRHLPAAPLMAASKPSGPRAALDLNSATVAFVWTYARKGDKVYQIMQGILRGEYPDISFVDYDVFGNIHGDTEAEVVAALPGLLKRHKADVAIIGIAA